MIVSAINLSSLVGVFLDVIALFVSRQPIGLRCLALVKFLSSCFFSAHFRNQKVHFAMNFESNLSTFKTKWK